MYKLTCSTMSYEWGKVGLESKVANLIQHSNQVDIHKPYAELWMGTHPNAPSKLKNGELLSSILTKDILGEKVFEKFEKKLPFLLKILSIKKALSIQAHPDKKLAEKLNLEKPLIYKDDNHKPEMAIALTRFEGLCGFKSLEAILKTIEENSELRSVIGMDTYRSFKITIQDFNATEEDRKLALKQVFKSLISCDRTLLQTELQNIVYRLKDSPDIKINGTTAELVNRLWSQFPNDVGIFCALLLNYICLNPGEAFFMAANEPHAYLSGDCVECMATSDNVVRAGLTPKLIDVDTLVEMLTYNHGEQRLLQPHYYHSKKYNKEFQHTLIFDPPIPEFFMMYTELQSTNFEFDPIDGPSMVIVLEGNGTFEVNNEVDKVAVGDVLFLASGSELIVNSVDGVKFCRAVCFVEEIL